MPYFYNGCDVFLVTSETEAHPMVVYEAMSCGIPVAATNVGDIPENIVDGYNGFILDVEAPVSAFVEKINLLRESPGLRKKMSVRARSTILQRWTWDKVVEQYRGIGRTMNDS
jgi:spore coat protein SA